MRYIVTVSAAVKLAFWLFTLGVCIGLLLGLQA